MIGKVSSAPVSPTTVAAFLGLAAFVFYQILISSHPVVYWGDAHIRLALRDQILVGHWLPLIQGLVFGVSKITGSLSVLRTVLSLIAVGALAGMYRLGSRLLSHAAGLIAAALLATNLMFAALATVPYPDVLFIGLVFFALEQLDEPNSPRNRYVGLIAINLACLARYEGWILAGMFMLESALQSFRALPRGAAALKTLKAALSYGLAPLGWLAFGVSQPGGPIARLQAVIAFETVSAPHALGDRLLSRLNIHYLQDFASQYFGLLEWQAHPLILALAAAGLLGIFFIRRRRQLHLRILAFLVLDWSLLALFQPWGFGNLRQPFVLQVFLILYAACGVELILSLIIDRLAQSPGVSGPATWGRLATSAAVLLITAASARFAIDFVAGAAHEADFLVPAQVGQWLTGRLTRDDAVLVLSDDTFQAYALATYVQLPFERVLDDRFDGQIIHSRLASSHVIYVIELYKSRAGLSEAEGRLLAELESGRTRAQQFPIGSSRVWVVARDSLLSSR